MDESQPYSSEDSNSPEIIDGAKNILINQGESLLFKDILSDFTIVVEDHKISAHKCLLYAQSGVFKAIFDPKNKDFKENQQNQLKIVDFSLSVVEDMLRFIYTSKVVTMSTNAQDLLIAADQV